jgi:hypothetical protein
MRRRSGTDEVRLPKDEEPIADVMILDGEGRLVRVVPATEFRRTAMGHPQPVVGSWRRLSSSRGRGPAGSGRNEGGERSVVATS